MGVVSTGDYSQNLMVRFFLTVRIRLGIIVFLQGKSRFGRVTAEILEKIPNITCPEKEENSILAEVRVPGFLIKTYTSR